MLRVLVIEDDEMYASLIEMALKREGLSISIANTPDEGFTMLTNDSFDVVVLDVALPGMSGIEVLKILRETPQTADLPIIIATASGTIATREAAQNAGADAFFEKPFSFRDMAAYIRGLFD